MNRKMYSMLFLCLILMSVNASSNRVVKVSASMIEISEMPAIKPYTQILNELNQEYGTEFAFPTNDIIAITEMNRSQVIEEILSVPVEDYEQFIRNAYNGINIEGYNQDTECSMTETQKAYYSSSNFL